MNAYTIAKLAGDAGVSVHIVRDYKLRGLVHPVRYTDSGYGLYDATALTRLSFVRAAVEGGIGLKELVRLCHALRRICRALLRAGRLWAFPGTSQKR